MGEPQDESGWVTENLPATVDDPNGILVRYQDGAELAAHRAAKCHVSVVCHSALKRVHWWTLGIKFGVIRGTHQRTTCPHCHGRAWWYLNEEDE